MFFGILILIVLSFLIGLLIGRRRKNPEPQTLQDAKAEAWKQGYEAAIAYTAGKAATGTKPASSESGAAQRGNSAAPWPPEILPLPGQAAPLPPQAMDRPPMQAPPAAKPAAAPALVKVLSAKERELRNINITLYVAALMIVAAGALFLSFALPDSAKVVALCILAAAFYAGGLIVHAKKKPLRPAAAAFTGTGLALLPLCALASYGTFALSGTTIWLVFSLLGTIAVGYATIRLRSKVLAWIAVAILVSTAMAAGAVLQRGLFYSLILLLGLSILLMMAATHSRTVIRSQFFLALSSTAQLLPALVILLLLFVLDQMSDRSMIWVCFALTVQLLLSIRLYRTYWILKLSAARVTGMLTIFFACRYLLLESQLISMVMAVLFAVQAVLVLRYGRQYRQEMGVSAILWRAERALLWVLVFASCCTAYLFTNSAYSLYLTAAAGNSNVWLSYIAVPLLMIATVPSLLRGAKIEIGAFLLLGSATLLDLGNGPSRVLVALGTVLLISVVMSRLAVGSTKLIYTFVMWAATLALGYFSAHTIVFEYGTQVISDRFGTPVLLAGLLGIWLPLLLWWVVDLLRLQKSTAGVRIIGAVIITLPTLTLLRMNLNTSTVVDWALGLRVDSSFVAVLLVSIVLIATSCLRYLRIGHLASRWGAGVQIAAAAALLWLYLLSFTATMWQLASIAGVLLLGYFLVSAKRADYGRARISYAALAQLTFSSAVFWFTTQMNFDHHGRYALFMVSLALPQMVRLILSRRSRSALGAELRWIAIAMLVLLPVSALMYMAASPQIDRGVLMLIALLFGTYGFAAFMADRGSGLLRQLYLVAPVLGVMALVQLPATNLSNSTGWIRSSWWDVPVALGLLLCLSALGLAADYRDRHKGSYVIATSALIFLPLANVIFWSPEAGWPAATSLFGACAFILLVHTRKAPWFAVGAGIGIAAGFYQCIALWRSEQSQNWMTNTDAAWSLLAATLTLWGLAAWHGRFTKQVAGYPPLAYRSATPAAHAARLYLSMALAAAALAGMLLHLGNVNSGPVISGAVLIFAALVAARIYECPRRLKPFTVDVLVAAAAILAMSSYSVTVQVPEVKAFLSYFSITAVILAAWRVYRPLRKLEHIYVVAAGVLTTVVMMLNMAEGDSLTRTYALVFFAALMSWGLKTGRKLYIWWGAVTITLAILWTLRSMAFLWLVLLGIALIVVAVRKLVRVDHRPNDAQDPGNVNAPMPPAPGAPPMQGMPPAPGAGMPWMNPGNQGSSRNDSSSGEERP